MANHERSLWDPLRARSARSESASPFFPETIGSAGFVDFQSKGWKTVSYEASSPLALLAVFPLWSSHAWQAIRRPVCPWQWMGRTPEDTGSEIRFKSWEDSAQETALMLHFHTALSETRKRVDFLVLSWTWSVRINVTSLPLFILTTCSFFCVISHLRCFALFSNRFFFQINWHFSHRVIFAKQAKAHVCSHC